jgi:hypothetical protein
MERGLMIQNETLAHNFGPVILDYVNKLCR